MNKRRIASFTINGKRECLRMTGTIRECLEFIFNSYPNAHDVLFRVIK